MFCGKCGNQLDDEALFCGECGTRVNAASTQTVPQPAPTQTVPQAAPAQTVPQPAPVQTIPQTMLVTKPKNPKKPFLIAGIFAAVLIIAAIIIIPQVANSGKSITGNADEIRFKSGILSINSCDSLEKHYKGKNMFGDNIVDYVSVDPKEVTMLAVMNLKGSDLEALKYCTNLKYLYIQWSLVDAPGKLDISPLGDLKKLESLTIFGGTSSDHDTTYKIGDLESLSGARSLLALTLSNCNITDVNGLEKLDDLRYLYIREDGFSKDTVIEDYSPLHDLDSLGRWTSELDDLRKWAHCPVGISNLTLSGEIDEYYRFYGLHIQNGNFIDHYENVMDELPNANVLPPLY